MKRLKNTDRSHLYLVLPLKINGMLKRAGISIIPRDHLKKSIAASKVEALKDHMRMVFKPLSNIGFSVDIEIFTDTEPPIIHSCKAFKY